MKTGFRMPADGPVPRRRESETIEGPGPNCPIRYTVDPDKAKRDDCVRAITLLRSSAENADLETQNTVSAAIASGLKWLEQWHKENDRLSWHYSTLRLGLKDPFYAPKFQAFHEDNASLRFLRAPNQVGKSYAAAAEVLFFASGKHPWREIDAKWADPLIAKTILIVTGSDKNREGVFQALWNLCPISDIDWINTHYDTRNMWGVRNPVIVFPFTNTRIIFRSSNQDTDSLNSLTVDGIWIDEPPKAGTIDEIRRAGLARDAWVLMSFTPVGEEGEDFTWLRDYVEGDEKHRSGEEGGKGPRGKWSQHQIAIEDCPWFDKDELESRRTAYREEQTPQRLFGEWEGAAVDRSFTHFKESGADRTVVDKWNIEDQVDRDNLLFAVGKDHGEKYLTDVAVLVVYRLDDPKAPAVILAERVSESKSTAEDDALAIIDMLASVGLTPFDIGLWVGDINTGGKEARGEKINMLVTRSLADHTGRPVRSMQIPDKYPGSVETEERRMNAAFKEKRLLVHARCKTILKSFRRYKGNGCDADKKLKHSLDAARYVLQNVLDRMRVCMIYSREYGGNRSLTRLSATNTSRRKHSPLLRSELLRSSKQVT